MEDRIADQIKLAQRFPMLFKGSFGIEKEAHRVTEEGQFCDTPHPVTLGNRDFHPYIKTDFAESQTEVVTDTNQSVQTMFEQLQGIDEVLVRNLEDGELLWPLSMPPALPIDHASIKVANLKPSAREYRELLVKRYGTARQMMTSVHYNFSLSNDFINRMYDDFYSESGTKVEFINHMYMKIAQGVYTNRYILTYLLGASPIAEENYFEKVELPTVPVRSLRDSVKYGYTNKESIKVPYTTVADYVKQIEKYIDRGDLSHEREFYGQVRFRGSNFIDMPTKGVDYLEIRSFDLDPFALNGVFQGTLEFIHAFLLFLLIKPAIADAQLAETFVNAAKISEQVALESPTKPSMYQKQIIDFLEEMVQFTVDFHAPDAMKKAVKRMLGRAQDYHRTISYRLVQEMKNDSLQEFALRTAVENRSIQTSTPYQLAGYEDMEMSTQMVIADAYQKGISVEVLDRQEQLLQLHHQQQFEIVKSGNITTRDSFVNALLVDDKSASKVLLARSGLNVPAGAEYTNKDELLADYDWLTARAIVIKPKSTNIGKGITIFKQQPSLADFTIAVDIAFKEDNEVLVESFISGTEYRFFLIDDEVLAVMERVPANVVGDGKLSIQELVDKKNDDEFRGEDHRKPLGKIHLNKRTDLMLKTQGYQLSDIPARGTQVFLLENSNISTGGDSIDVTSEIDPSYFEVAISAAKALNMKVTGIDIIIPNLYQEYNPDYPQMATIIEGNYNPAMAMHLFPYRGEPHRLTAALLDYLFPILA